MLNKVFSPFALLHGREPLKVVYLHTRVVNGIFYINNQSEQNLLSLPPTSILYRVLSLKVGGTTKTKMLLSPQPTMIGCFVMLDF